ncbi:MAG: hypothetical protein ACLUDY_20960 [Bacteroides xylanisolvens]
MKNKAPVIEEIIDILGDRRTGWEENEATTPGEDEPVIVQELQTAVEGNSN